MFACAHQLLNLVGSPRLANVAIPVHLAAYLLLLGARHETSIVDLLLLLDHRCLYIIIELTVACALERATSAIILENWAICPTAILLLLLGAADLVEDVSVNMRGRWYDLLGCRLPNMLTWGWVPAVF